MAAIYATGQTLSGVIENLDLQEFGQGSNTRNLSLGCKTTACNQPSDMGAMAVADLIEYLGQRLTSLCPLCGSSFSRRERDGRRGITAESEKQVRSVPTRT